jgi:hypothetical protein
MCRPETRHTARTIAAAATLSAALAGCSDIYLDRRDTIALSAGDAVAANMVEQTADPWPPNSGNPNIAYNGQKMQSAVERYRNDKVTPPVEPTTLEIMAPPQAGAAPTGTQTSSGGTSSTGTASPTAGASAQ